MAYDGKVQSCLKSERVPATFAGWIRSSRPVAEVSFAFGRPSESGGDGANGRFVCSLSRSIYARRLELDLDFSLTTRVRTLDDFAAVPVQSTLTATREAGGANLAAVTGPPPVVSYNASARCKRNNGNRKAITAHNKFSVTLQWTVCAVLLGCTPPSSSVLSAPASRAVHAASGSYVIDYAFPSLATGAAPVAGLTYLNGVLYGTTSEGGNGKCGQKTGCGTVFALSMPSFQETRLHSFGAGSDGAVPTSAPVVLQGHLLGTTTGPNNGTLYDLNPKLRSQKPAIYALSQRDGVNPFGGLVAGNGVVYGTTSQGGKYGWGTVFACTPGASLQVLHDFRGHSDGASPNATLLLEGNILYGTTTYGGGLTQNCHRVGCGTVFVIDLTPSPSGWQETVLHKFSGGSNDGAYPSGSLAFPAKGTLYGTTSAGGGHGDCAAGGGCGTLFAMTPSVGPDHIVWAFGSTSTDGHYPSGAIVHDGGSMYGTTAAGGSYNLGTVFAIPTDGHDEVLLHEFAGGRHDGSKPQAGLVFASDGRLYGTTSQGGNDRCSKHGCGTIFSLAP